MDSSDVERELLRLHQFTHYLRTGLTWPRRTDGLSFRALPAGCIFADKAPAAFVAGDDPQDLLALLALLNSRAFAYLVGFNWRAPNWLSLTNSG
jgi:hypothetical protein